MKQLRQQPGGPIYLAGGGILAGQLLLGGQIATLVVKSNPLLLGSGVGLFTAFPAWLRLRLTNSRAHENGVVVSSYRVLSQQDAESE